jgi:hypothetical protein
MLVEWKKLLVQNGIPENRWPSDVQEVEALGKEALGAPKTTLVMYPAEIPATVVNPKTGRTEWNPEVKDGLELIYKAYRSCLGKLGAPSWSRTGNYVKFQAIA